MPVYLESFTLPGEGREEVIMKRRMRYNGGDFGYLDNAYPCGMFPRRGLSEIYFKKTTIFYGGNGSGKTTLLNLIAEKLELKRSAPYNTGEMSPLFVKECSYEMGRDEEGDMYRIPNGSRIITSDDIFDYMLSVRDANEEISAGKRMAREDYANWKYGRTVRFTGMEDYDELVEQIHARRAPSRRQYIKDKAGSEVRLRSNGETALEYFSTRFSNDTLYCLDEPENSMSPALQLKLLDLIEEITRYCGCQIIMATHSPFLLSAEDARIYDLDSEPVVTKNWWELENTRTYWEFFRKNSALFEKDEKRQ